MATINKRGDSWQLQWSDASGQHRISLGAISREEAETKRQEKELERRTGKTYSVRAVLFRDFARQYLDWYESHYPSTIERTAGIFRASLAPHFGHMALDEIAPPDAHAWMAWRRAQGPSPATISKEARALAAMMRKAVEWGLLERNLIAGVKPPPERQSKAPQFYTAEQLNALYAISGDYKPVWRFMANTGLRRNEALYLRYADIGADAIMVESREDRPTKSRRFRSVPLNDAAKEAIEELRKRPTASGYLLQRIDPRSLTRAYLKAASRAGIPGTLHTLRHTFISHLVMSGVDLATVKAIAGHSSITTTMRYAHLSQEHAIRAVNRISL